MDTIDLDKMFDDFDKVEAMRQKRTAIFGDAFVPDELSDDEVEYSDFEFNEIVSNREKFKKLNNVEQEIAKRWADVELLRQHYALFEDFLHDCMTELLGFECSDLQVDIGRFLESLYKNNIRRAMVQAQRSQAKSTIVAIFAVWKLIHNCRFRILIVSAGGDVALEIANWVIQIIMNWDILQCLRPDRQHGDRSSSKAFDINWQLKGPEKSPSIACLGITASMQGRRSDLLIPDDIESSKNGLTETQREHLRHLSRDFASICQHGHIIYLGTPQSVDSVYNDLEDRGYLVRIWPGRVPTDSEAKHYGDKLAPFVARMMDNPLNQIGGGLDGSRGKPTDPIILSEQQLQEKELDQGQAYFNLQHMLNTEMSDELRHPLKPKNLIVMHFGTDKAPGEITWLPNPEKRIAVSGYQCKPELYRPFAVSSDLYEFEGKHMYVDPAGGGKNGDETVAAVTYFLHGYVFLAELLKLPGGYSDSHYAALSELALRHRVNSIEVEKNFGFGMFAAAWRPVLKKKYTEAGLVGCPAVEDVWESGQKELRIIDTLEPLVARHRLIINEGIIEYDQESVKKYPIEQRESYKFLHQFARITRDLKSLIHDDSIDAVAGACRKWVEIIAVDEKERIAQKETDDNIAFMKSWGADIGQSSLGGNIFVQHGHNPGQRYNHKAVTTRRRSR